MGIIPNKVDNPAKVVIKKLTIIEFILKHMKKKIENTNFLSFR